MTRRAFDRFMVDNEIGGNLKLIGLTDSEWRAHVGGVLAIAAKSPIRGFLMIGDLPAGPEHVAAQAHVTVATARNAMRKLREVGVISTDAAIGREYVHDWDEWNPAPKADHTAAERQRRRREKLRDAQTVTRDSHGVTPTKEKGREEEVTTVDGSTNVVELRGVEGSGMGGGSR